MRSSKHSSTIHTVVRSVIAINNQILLAHCKGASNTFLPGGHVKYGEAATSALQRELAEECQMRLNIIRFLGIVEHVYGEAGRLEHEINLCFLGELPELKDVEPIKSKEKHLEFFWVSTNKLSEYNLRPYPFQSLIPKILDRDDPYPWFESTIKD